MAQQCRWMITLFSLNGVDAIVLEDKSILKLFFFFFSHTLIQVGYLDPTSELDLAHFYTHDWISTDFPQIIEHLEKKHIYTTVNKKKNNDKLMKLQNNSNWHTMYKIDIYKGEKQL